MKRFGALFLLGIAFGHPVHTSLSSPFLSGLAHPLTGADHLAVMLAVGALGAYLGGKKALLPPLGFVGGMLAGTLLAFRGFSPSFAELGILFSLLVFGLMLLMRARLLPAVFLLSVLGGVFHGFAHGTEAPAGTDELLYTAGMLLSTATLHALGILAGLRLRTLTRALGALLIALALV
ncbi:MAG: HupE/UreJ family protein [Aquificae bacterium]|nr:HupE/UreJ family protein [Aquificota bacterium]